jgi:serine phosphatase RsbU (regulator of sigma subunit)
MPSLILIKAPGGSSAGQSYHLTAETIVLGREDTCDIVIPNHAVSRRHAQVTRSNGQFFIDDLKSRNHTFVNNREVNGKTELKHDDRIKICDFLFRFHDERVAPPDRPKLPPELTTPPDAAVEDPGGLSTIEHTVAARQAAGIIDAQPAEKLRALLDISAALSKTLELGPLLDQIGETVLAVFRQADRCFIILQEEGDKLIPKVVKTRRPSLGEDPRFSRTIVRRCLQSQEAYLSEDAGADQNLGAAQSIAEFRIRSVMCVPLLTADGVPLGAVQVDTQNRGNKFTKDDLNLILIVANLAAVAIEKAKQHEQILTWQKQQHEIKLAQEVQLGFLPQSAPELPGYEFYSFYGAALTVGGDYYDFVPLPDGRIAVVLGDVAGKGVPASLLMAKLSAEARYCLLTQPDLVSAVNLLNEQLIRGGIGDRFVTLAAAVLNSADHAVTLVNAGHMNPMLYRVQDGTLEEAVTSDQSGIPLGILAGFEYTAVRLTLDVGDSLLLYTDGVTDAVAPDGEMFQVEGIRKALLDETPVGFPTRPKGIGERVLHCVRKHANGRAQNDDIALVCFGRLEPGAPSATGSGANIKMVPDSVGLNARDLAR